MQYLLGVIVAPQGLDCCKCSQSGSLRAQYTVTQPHGNEVLVKGKIDFLDVTVDARVGMSGSCVAFVSRWLGRHSPSLAGRDGVLSVALAGSSLREHAANNASPIRMCFTGESYRCAESPLAVEGCLRPRQREAQRLRVVHHDALARDERER